MIVCHCKAVTDRAVRSAVREGAASLRCVGRACGAGTVCGGCRPTIQEILVVERTAVTVSLEVVAAGDSLSA